MATLEKIDRQIAQLKERRADVLARERERKRKQDTRCKILLGSGLLAMVREGDAQAQAVFRRIRAAVDERAARAFEGWDGPSVQTKQTPATEESS